MSADGRRGPNSFGDSARRAGSQPEVTPDECEQVLQKLEQLDADFRKYHLAIVDLTDDDEALETEQEALDIHDDRVHDRLRRLMAKSSASRTTESDTRRRLARG